MSIAIEDSKRTAIACKLADIKEMQNLLIANEEKFMSGVLVHKAAQVVGADVEAAITPLNTLNFENRAHEEQLKGVLEVLGVRELMGQEAQQGLWARVQDSVAALSGIVGSAVTQISDKSDMSIQDIIRMDHVRQEENTMFAAIRSNCSDAQQEQLATQFKTAKSKLQAQLAA